MKTIFLDIDGPLATNKQFFINKKKFWENNQWAKNLKVPYPFDKECVQIFNEILEETDAEIVLSSDWKNHWDLIDLDIIFKNNNIIKSPRSLTKNDVVSMNNIEKNRAYQIELFIHNFKIDNYVVIDDLNLTKFMNITQDDDKFVLIKESQGLKEIGVKEKIIRILNKNKF